MKKINGKIMQQGLMLFAVGLALIAAWYIIHNMRTVREGLEVINGILMPFYVGIVLAYLISPIYNQVVKVIYRGCAARLEKAWAYRLARVLGTVISIVTMIAAVGGFCLLIIPDLWVSITGLVQNMPDMVDQISKWVMANIVENPQLAALLQDNLETVMESVENWFQSQLKPAVDTVISGAAVGIIGTFSAVLDAFVALIICIYVLNGKEIFLAQAKKLVLALFKPERAESIFELASLANRTFGGFINGKIIDSIIIGILCFIAMSLLNLPMTTLISVIVGVTNVIPFFGPFIGAVPSIVLLLLVDPIAALKFGILVLVLQQLDGNVIGPKILGDSTGLASFWVMFAILMGGGLFGFVGMVLGVPSFAVLYIYIARFVNGRLKKKGLQNDTVVYEDLKKYDINKEDIFGKESVIPDSGAAGSAAEPVERK